MDYLPQSLQPPKQSFSSHCLEDAEESRKRHKYLCTRSSERIGDLASAIRRYGGEREGVGVSKAWAWASPAAVMIVALGHKENPSPSSEARVRRRGGQCCSRPKQSLVFLLLLLSSSSPQPPSVSCHCGEPRMLVTPGAAAIVCKRW